jgi:hypothetical protein
MNWYIAKMNFQIKIENNKTTTDFDEQLRLIAANTLAEAYHKATIIGKHEQTMFTNDAQQQVKWQFINISELHLLNDIADGMQLYSNTYQTFEPENYLQIIEAKAAYIQHKSTIVNTQSPILN